ncbi:MAG: glutamate--tRNA ligase [Candidatus Eisenbacteria bacterium]|nr:glutamate--tRNA ligase [Candidatus Eisenbacteria bacterium]
MNLAAGHPNGTAAGVGRPSGDAGRPVRVRFAPSPTGHLHVGGARTALFNWLFAKHEGGAFVLRVEDTDVARSTVDSEAAVLEDLRWLGLDWDEGPDRGGPYGPYRQSERLGTYREQADRLLSSGLAYPCYCADEELEEKRRSAMEEGRDPRYDGKCRNLSVAERAACEAAGLQPVLRFRTEARDVEVRDLVRGEVRFAAAMLGDFVIMRSDGRPTYNFAVVVDDALMRISHVIRAEEHLSNTMRQVLLYEALGFDAPRFAHVSLIVDRDRSKLSKRRGATSVSEFRDAGYLPGALVNYLALLGWSPPGDRELLARGELVEAFDLERVSPAAAAFDEDKLDWVNAHHIREEPAALVARLARPFAETAGLLEEDEARFEAMVELARPRVSRLSDIPGEIDFFFDGAWDYEEEAANALGDKTSRSVVLALLERLADGEGALAAADFKGALSGVGMEEGVRGKDLYIPVRAALTGRTHGPGIGEVAELLGRERVVQRLSRALEM